MHLSFLKPITIAEVLRYIKDLNPAKSSGLEGIPLKFIIMGAEVISPILVNLYNQCINTGTYPNILKIAQVIPLQKLSEESMQ